MKRLVSSCNLVERVLTLKISKVLVFLFVFPFLIGCKNTVDETADDGDTKFGKKTIMAIFAHPDDETVISPVLTKFADDANVHVVVSTDGRYGVTDHAGIPAGDSLVSVRKKEMICACEALGINTPHFLGAKDGLGLNGNHNFYDEVLNLKENIKDQIETLKPDVILTFGPDGDTGHPDHRMVGLLTTEILLRENWVDAIDLYYFAWTKEQTKKFPEEWGLGWSHPDVLHTEIKFNEKDEESAFISLRCHQSQYTNTELDTWVQAERNDTANVLYFRKFALDTTIRSAF